MDPLLWLVPRHHHLGKLLDASGLQTCPLHSLLAAADGTLELGPEIPQIARQAVRAEPFPAVVNFHFSTRTGPRRRPAAEQRLLGTTCLPKGGCFALSPEEVRLRARYRRSGSSCREASGRLCAWAGLACREPPAHMKARGDFPGRLRRPRQSRAPARSHARERGAQRK